MSKNAVKKEKPKFAPTSYKQALFINSDSFLNVYGGAAGCLDATAEYLTPEGWKYISDYDGGLVAQWDSETDTVSFTQPKNYIKKPCTSFKRMKARGLDFILSDEHRVPYFNENDLTKPKVITWEEVLKRHSKSKTKGWTGKIKTSFKYSGKGLDLTEGELRLQIAVQADGRVVKEGANNYTQMRFAKKRKYDRLKWILDTWNLPYKDNGRKDSDRYLTGESFEIIVYPKYADKVFDAKYYQATQEQLHIICEEFQYWDGTTYSENHSRYSTTVKENADFIQFAIHACGYNSSLTVREAEGNCKEHYQIDRVSKGKGFRSFVGKDYKQEIETFQSTDGFKYCFEVESSFFVVRQNGNVFITGNSGKTYMSLMRFLRWTHLADFNGYVFRTNATDLKKQGGAFWTAVKMFQEYDKRVTYTQQPMVIKFPSGATISFTGMDDEAGRKAIHGIEISAAMLDEATHFLEEDIWWIISRLRTNAPMSPNIWLTCNPDDASCIFDWIHEYYLYPKGTIVDDELVEGRPNAETNGDERFYLRVGNDLKWANTFEELFNQYKSKFPKDPITGESTCKPRSFRFIGSTCFDNPEMLKKNPDYVSSLASQPRVTMERLLLGSWFAKEETSGYFRRDWVTELDPRKPEDMSYLKDVTRRVRAWDIAGTLPSEANPDPDWTAGVLIARTRDGRFIIEDVQHVRKRSGENLEFIIGVAENDRKMFGNGVQTYLPLDPAEAGKAIKVVRAKEFAMRGIPVKFEKVGTKKSKLDKFIPFSSAAENGCVYVVKADWNTTYYRELENFDGISRRYHDDLCDGTSSAYNVLATTKEYKKLNLALIG